MTARATSSVTTQPSSSAPRAAALAILSSVLTDQNMLGEAVGAHVKSLDPPGRARAQSLASGTLRWLDRADRLLGRYLRNKPYDHTLNILRLAAFEICQDGQAAHGVVNDLVAVAKANDETRRYAGLINAVLRKLAKEGPDLWPTLPVPRLPKPLRKALIVDYDRKTIESFERAHANGAPLDLTIKANQSAPEGFEKMATGTFRAQGTPQVSGLAGFSEGTFWVQDAAAALPAWILDPKPGQTVLDLCAAPGGKTMQMAASGAHVTALDISKARMSRLRENLERTKLEANIVVDDVLTFSGGLFDAVLLDAPCSATGTIRRHPDLPYLKTLDDLKSLATLQRQMLAKAWEHVKPGGSLVYCTCSLLKREGEVQIAAALDTLTDASLNREALALNGIDPAWIGDTGLRLQPDFWPEIGGMDGFFIARLDKSA